MGLCSDYLVAVGTRQIRVAIATQIFVGAVDAPLTKTSHFASALFQSTFTSTKHSIISFVILEKGGEV